MQRNSFRLLSSYVNYYHVLGISRSSSIEEIKAAYRVLAKVNHPDTPTGDADKFKVITQAYEVLKDSKNRKAYDFTYNDRGQRTQYQHARDPRKQYDYRGSYESFKRRSDRAYDAHMGQSMFAKQQAAWRAQEQAYRASLEERRQAAANEYHRRQQLEDQKWADTLQTMGVCVAVLGALVVANLLRETAFSKHPKVSWAKSPYLHK
jgi:DnaJ-class molecular chaperone